VESLFRGRLVSFAVLVAASAVGPLSILHFFGREQVQVDNWIHFGFLAFGSLAAASAALALTIVGARRGDGRTVLLGTAFSVMTGILAVHGLATPGILTGPNGVIAFSGAAVLPVGGAVLALSALPALRRPTSVRPLLWLQGVLLLSVVGLGVVGILVPESVPAVPESGSTPAVALLVVGLCFFAAITLRAVRTYTLTRRRADLLVVVGLVWLAAALVSQLLLSYLDLGWWIGHAMELLGVLMVGVPVALDVHRGAASRPLAGDLRGTELVAAEEAFLGSNVRALMSHLAGKDAYTELHTRRVALRAVQVGEQLGLSAGRLRSLAIGGLLHDMGKLSVPDEILQKPGALTDDEYAVIRCHPEWGRSLVRELGGFPAEVERLVMDHHERLDGAGYPRGLGEDRLDLETRIMSVCDVYDALMSQRVYRAAWTQEAALELLREQSGTAFDPRCVAALEQVLEDERRTHESPVQLTRDAQTALA
jgi:HD-GYP domain-containing protein (c-di-GMP phosphodiesterase class II)